MQLRRAVHEGSTGNLYVCSPLTVILRLGTLSMAADTECLADITYISLCSTCVLCSVNQSQSVT